jgi:hypothetical protein
MQAAPCDALKGCANSLSHPLAGHIVCERNDLKTRETQLTKAKKGCLLRSQLGNAASSVWGADLIAYVANAVGLVDLIDTRSTDHCAGH